MFNTLNRIDWNVQYFHRDVVYIIRNYLIKVIIILIIFLYGNILCGVYFEYQEEEHFGEGDEILPIHIN